MLPVGLKVVGCPLLLSMLYMGDLTGKLPSSGAVIIQVNYTYANKADNMVVNFKVS
jgi:hypothetical protein